MSEYPILFNAEMVRAILDGRKTQTRRVVNPTPDDVEIHRYLGGTMAGKIYPVLRCYNPPKKFENCASGWTPTCPGPFNCIGSIGDRLWVRETHRSVWSEALSQPHIQYRADYSFRTPEDHVQHNSFASILPDNEDGSPATQSKWRPSIFLKREHARIFLEVTGVRVERLQDISESDAEAEGAFCMDLNGVDESLIQLLDTPHQSMDEAFKNGFSSLWDSINEKRGHGWATNPWVWVYTFKVIEVKGGQQ